MIRLPRPCLVVLVGPSGSGKSHWATTWFAADEVLSSDHLRSLVGEGEHDQRAGTDAFDVLDLVLERRLRRRLLTVVDSLALDAARRRAYIDVARRHDVPVIAVAFDTAPAECRGRNAERPRPVPAKVLAGQLRQWPAVRDALGDEGFDAVLAPGPVRVVDPQLVAAAEAADRQCDDPLALDFGLYLGSFTWAGGPSELGTRLAAIAGRAEEVGFTSLWVMDHLVQVPQVGRHWDEMLESWTALAFLAAHTSTISLGTLVTAVTYRNVALLGKIAATVDVVSGGRVVCGIGAGWYRREHDAYGIDFPPVAERFALLEDALQLLPMLWGPGAPAFKGRVVEVPEAICYPRPLQERIPILVGGSGERKTLRLVARYGDACNLAEDPATVKHKVEVLRRHCADVDRDPCEVRVTHRSTVLVSDDAPRRLPERSLAGSVADHIGRFRELAEAGVQTAMVRLIDVEDAGALDRFAPVIDAFRVGP